MKQVRLFLFTISKIKHPRFLHRLALLGLFAALSTSVLALSPTPLSSVVQDLEQQSLLSETKDFSFVILGDKTSGGEGKWPIFDAAVSEINRLKPDFVITVGDMINGHMQERGPWDAEWAEYWTHAKAIQAPLLFTPGNHDIANLECYAYWKEDFGKTYYAFDYQSAHFLILNTEEERVDGRGPVWEKMLRFAEKDLAQHKEADHTFLFFHKPMWDDPRFLEDWARIEAALGERPFTVVVGHEHYLSTMRKNGNLYIIQNATGGGIDLSPVTKIGCFHGYSLVKVSGKDVQVKAKKVGGSFYPIDAAPDAFRKAITYELVQMDAIAPVYQGEQVLVKSSLHLNNVLDKKIKVKTAFAPMDRCGWRVQDAALIEEEEDAWIEVDLERGEKRSIPITFHTTRSRLAFPPSVTWSVNYEGQWLNKETMRMVEMDAVPIYPRASLRAVDAWQLVGPFALGPIDTSFLPDQPRKANPNFFKRFGPEEGYVAGREYEGGKSWFAAPGQGFGLLNFNALMGTLDFALGYASCAVYSPVAQQTHAAVYADNFAQVVLNGVLIESAQELGATGGFVYVPLALQEGWNRVVVKEINNKGDWFLRFLIYDPQDNLRIADKES